MDRRKARHRSGPPNVRKPPGSPVTVNRSPYEGVRAGSQESSSPYKNWSDMRNAGFVEHRDINGNMEWIDKKTGKPAGKSGADQTEPQLVQKMDINGNYQMVDPKTGLKRDGTPLNPPRFPNRPQAGRQAKAATPEDPMAGRGTDVPDLNRIGTGDLPTNAELDAGDGLTRALTPEEASRVASFGLGDTSTPSIADEGRTLLDAYTDENGVTHGHAATRDEIDQLNKKEADLQHQAKLADEFNAYKKVTDKQEAGLSETQKAARDLEKPGVAEADREKAKAETNIDLLQMEDRLQKQRDEAEIAQIMADPSEHPATEDDQRLQNPVDRMRAATQRQTDRQQNRDRQELSSALTGAEIAGSAATGYLNGDLSATAFQQEAAKETEGANIAQVANDTLGTLGIGSGTGEGSLTDSDVAKVNGETDTLSGMQNLDQMTAQIASQDSVQTEDEKEDQAAAKGGDGDRFATSRNFLATDKVPDTIFGYPVVSRREDYTQADIAFFEKHPEAGGYYDLGEGSPEDGTEEGAPTQDDEPGPEAEFMARNPTLFSHVKKYEKLELSPYEDVGGYAIGYGTHMDANGAAVTATTAALRDEAAAAALLARDLYARREALKASLPNWDFIPGKGKQALLDVAMGRDDVLSANKSKGLHRDLRAAGRDPEKLLAAVKKHYYSYRKSERPEDQAGLEARRIAGGRAFFGEEFSYKDKEWDPARGFVKKGGR